MHGVEHPTDLCRMPGGCYNARKMVTCSQLTGDGKILRVRWANGQVTEGRYHEKLSDAKRPRSCELCDELLFNKPSLTSNKDRRANKICAKVSEPDHMVVAEGDGAGRSWRR